MAPPKQRTRAFAPKSRSGCDLCKQRRVKCDELRPNCGNCKKRGTHCSYTAPKIWIFEPKQQRKVDETKAVQPSEPFDLTGLTICDWPADEKYLMRYYIRRSGPYMSQYTFLEARKMWSVMVPRLANTFPAMRHLVVAIALMDLRLNQATRQALRARTESVIVHYNKAIGLLTANSASMVEVIASAILAYVLETMIRDTAAANIHLQAAEQLLSRVGESVKGSCGSEAEGILVHDLRAMYISAAAYHATEPTFRPTQDSSATSVFNAVTALHSPQGLRSVKEVVVVYERLFEHLSSKDPLVRPNVEQLKAFTSKWELAILQLSHDSPEPRANLFAAHMLICVANALVPRLSYGGLTEEQLALQSPTNVTAMGYIVHRLDLLLEENIHKLGKRDEAIFNRILKLASRTITQFAPNDNHRNKAKLMLTKVETRESLATTTEPSDRERMSHSSFAGTAADASEPDSHEHGPTLSEFALQKLRIIEPLKVPHDTDLHLRSQT
ncbi:hypothetical protein LTR84_008471 [Exophiala bonariae]|uniref:Zn(2)-C6 fungal-type domain-containing protein n=1 Tax=Exophiala bonariae TaxID=1690606 RepID=A0AAV9MXA9_9EURO|nr:hypothetical protein LTR84_008471 [Exophiala bonariae]